MIYIGISIIVLLAVMGAYIMYAAYAKGKDVMSFKQSMELCDLPIITFYIGEKKLNFILDTGCIQSMLDADIIDKYKLNDIIKDYDKKGLINLGKIKMTKKDKPDAE